MKSLIDKIAIYFNTIRYLKPIQIYWRLWMAIRPTPIPPLPVNVSLRQGFFLKNSLNDYSLKDNTLSFLNLPVNIAEGMPWHNHSLSKLWLYNLHYFHYLSCDEVKGAEIIRDWIEKNPPAKGVGWEPYPTALRIVSWVKYYERIRKDGREGDIREDFLPSLYQQACHMEKSLEYHLLGNHLLKDIKALLFAGCFFDGSDADRWLKKGLALLDSQLREQILQDGGHFERSPMYHAIALEDLLDIYNAFSGFSSTRDKWGSVLEDLAPYITRMIKWQEMMMHPDGDIAQFNDSSLIGSSRVKDTLLYASRLDIYAPPTPSEEKLVHLGDSGYCITRMERFTCIIDIGEIGPSYIPGHAHCDTLSYELSIGKQRVIIDSGVYGYEANEFRYHLRSTAAHNTVIIDEEEQSEIWKSFRVARRACPREVVVRKSDNSYVISAAHDGYQRLNGHPLHRRTFSINEEGILIDDRLEGEARHTFTSFIHFLPGLNIEQKERSNAWMVLDSHGLILLEIVFYSNYPVTLSEDWYCPEFGKKELGKVLSWSGEAEFPVSTSYFIKVA